MFMWARLYNAATSKYKQYVKKKEEKYVEERKREEVLSW